MSVSVDASINDSTKEVSEDGDEALGSEHTMKCTHEHCLARIKPLGRAAHIIGIRQKPRDNLKEDFVVYFSYNYSRPMTSVYLIDSHF